MPHPRTLLVVLVLSAGASAYAQSPARVSGRVLDQTGAALPGVSIDLVVNSRQWTTSTNEAGACRFEDVQPGRGELTYRLLNFSALRRYIHTHPALPRTARVGLQFSF